MAGHGFGETLIARERWRPSLARSIKWRGSGRRMPACYRSRNMNERSKIDPNQISRTASCQSRSLRKHSGRVAARAVEHPAPRAATITTSSTITEYGCRPRIRMRTKDMHMPAYRRRQENVGKMRSRCAKWLRCRRREGVGKSEAWSSSCNHVFFWFSRPDNAAGAMFSERIVLGFPQAGDY